MKITKVRSDYDPSCILTLIKDDQGDVIMDINKRMTPDGEGEFRIAMSGGNFHGEKKTKIIRLVSELIDAFNDGKEDVK